VKTRIVQVERRRHSGDTLRHRAAHYSALILVDESLDVTSMFFDSHRVDESARFLSADGTRLLPDIEAAVATLIRNLETCASADAQLIILDEDRAMRLSPLVSHGRKTFALVIEADRNADYITRAVSRYRLTNRQVDVLLLVLEGANAGDVARRLDISEYTAQGYIKRLLSKTDSKNRTAMVAKVLDWSGMRPYHGTGARDNGVVNRLRRLGSQLPRHEQGLEFSHEGVR
jgi:DNA-binding CsgD family transcriptional regulator